MPAIAVDMLAAAPPQVAKQWGIEKAFGGNTLAVDRGRLRPTETGLKSAWWATPELVDRVGAIAARQSDRDEELALARAEAIDSEYTDDGMNGTIEFALHDRETGSQLVGFFKPVSGIDDVAAEYGQYGVESIIHEAAAWQFAKALGPEYEARVPPCILTVRDGDFGSIAQERPGRTYSYSAVRPEQIHTAGFYDALIRQQDRHSGNYLVDDDENLYLIDHGFSFSGPDDHLNQANLQRERYNSAPDLTQREREQLQRLLKSEDLLGLRRMIQADRADALEERAAEMLSTGRVLRDEYVY